MDLQGAYANNAVKEIEWSDKENSVTADSAKTTPKFAVAIISIVFFMWGFVTCLNDILIPHLKSVFTLSYSQSALIQFAFFGAYFVFALPAGKVVSRLGYKKTISLGLLISAVGAAMFYPAAEFLSYNAFLAALFVLAAGITFLQVSANPYVTLLGPTETAPSRLNLTQALNSLGTTIAPAIGSLMILSATVQGATPNPVEEANSVKGPYLLLTAILVLLAITIYMIHLPESAKATNEERKNEGSFFSVLRHRNVLLAVIGLFLYVGAEVSIGSFLVNYIALPNMGNLSISDAAHYVPFYWGGAMIGRFAGSAIMRKVDAGKVLGIAAAVATVLSAAGAFAEGMPAVWMVIGIGLFNSIMFPTIFSLGVRNLGHETEKASSLLIMAIVGGALLPLLMGAMADSIGLQLAMILPLVCYLFISYYGFKGSRSAVAA